MKIDNVTTYPTAITAQAILSLRVSFEASIITGNKF